MQLYTGAALERFPGPKYLGELAFFEYVPKEPWPRGATLTRFRHSLPDGAAPAIRAPQAALVAPSGPLRPDPQRAERWAWTLDAAERLEARIVVLPTPASLTPGKRSRDLLRRFAEALPRPAGRQYVWAPRGVWEEADSAQLAAELELVRAFDPLHEDRPVGPTAFARLRALGGHTSFSDATLLDAIAALAGPEVETAWLSIESDRSVEQARRAVALATAADDYD